MSFEEELRAASKAAFPRMVERRDITALPGGGFVSIGRAHYTHDILIQEIVGEDYFELRINDESGDAPHVLENFANRLCTRILGSYLGGGPIAAARCRSIR